jgi:Lon protease-like protein
MATTSLIPLFPLSIVVFPGQLVPLHIFEERYKEMIADCHPDGGSFDHFGIILATGESIASTGCSVAVMERGQTYPDGAFDMVGKAERRFTVIESFENRPYQAATVAFLEDEGIAHVDPTLQEAAEERYTKLIELAKREKGSRLVGGGGEAEPPDRVSGALPSFAICASLGMDLRQKQQILEMRSESERLQRLVDYLDQLLPALQSRLEQTTRVKSNGRPRRKGD